MNGRLLQRSRPLLRSGNFNSGTLEGSGGLDGNEITGDLTCLLTPQVNGRVGPAVDEVAHMEAVVDILVQGHDPVLAENEKFINYMSRHKYQSFPIRIA